MSLPGPHSLETLEKQLEQLIELIKITDFTGCNDAADFFAAIQAQATQKNINLNLITQAQFTKLYQAPQKENDQEIAANAPFIDPLPIVEKSIPADPEAYKKQLTDLINLLASADFTGCETASDFYTATHKQAAEKEINLQLITQAEFYKLFAKGCPAATQNATAKKPWLTSHSRLAIDLAVSLASSYWIPTWFAPYAANRILADLLNKMVMPHIDLSTPKTTLIGNESAQLKQEKEQEINQRTKKERLVEASKFALNLIINFSLPNTNPAALFNKYLAYAQEYGPLFYLAVPASVLLYKKRTEIWETCQQQASNLSSTLKLAELKEASHDFCDMMYGQADDEVYEKYQGSWATKDVCELADEVIAQPIQKSVNWLWQKCPSFSRKSVQMDEVQKPEPHHGQDVLYSTSKKLLKTLVTATPLRL